MKGRMLRSLKWCRVIKIGKVNMLEYVVEKNQKLVKLFVSSRNCKFAHSSKSR